MPWNKQHSAVANSSCAVVGIARGPVHCHRKLARCVGFAVLAACAGASLGAGLTGQGLYPGDPDANAIKLPGDFEAVIRPRMFYKNTDTLTGGEQEAWVIGGLAGLRSPWVADLLQFGAVGYISQKLSGPAGKGGTLLLQPDQSSIYVLGEAWGALRVAGQTITGYRQLIDRPFINTWDNREIPQTFEAYSLTGAAGALSYTGGYLTKVKTRGSEDFLWASQVAGAPGSQKGVIYAGATYAFANSGYIKLDEVYSTDVFNTFYIEGRYPFSFDDKTRLTLGAQYFPQKSVGDDLIGNFSTWGYGLNAALSYGAVTGQLYYTQTGTGFTTQSPYGDNPSYLNLQQIVFNTAGEKAWGFKGLVDFATLGVPGLTGYVFYASGKDRINSANGAPLPNHHETDLRADYAFAKGTWADGFVATFRYSWLHQDGSPQTQTDLRAILNYVVRF